MVLQRTAIGEGICGGQDGISNPRVGIRDGREMGILDSNLKM